MKKNEVKEILAQAKKQKNHDPVAKEIVTQKINTIESHLNDIPDQKIVKDPSILSAIQDLQYAVV